MNVLTSTIKKAGFVFFLLTIVFHNLYAITTTCISSGLWSNSATWDNGVPTPTDDVVVTSGYTVSMDGMGASCNSIALSGTIDWIQVRTTTVGAGGITMYNGAAITGSLATGNLNCTGPLSITSGAVVTIGRVTLNATGTTTIDGGSAQLTFNNASGTKSFADVTINSGGTWFSSVSEDFNISGNLTVNGIFASVGGDYTFTGIAKSIGGTSAVSLYGLIINNGASLTNNTSLTVVSKLQSTSGTGSLTNAADKSLSIQVSTANYSLTTLIASSSGNTVDFSYSGSQTIPAIIYNHVSFGGSGIKTLEGSITANGNISIVGSAELYSPSYDIVGNLTGTVTMASGTTMRLGNSASTADVRFPSLYPKSNITLNVNSEVIFQGGDNQTIDCTPDYGNVTLSTGASQKDKTPNATTFTIKGNLSINTNVVLKINANNLLVSGNITSSGTVDMTSGEVYVGGNWTGGGAFTYGTSTVYYNGSGDQSVMPATYYHLTINNSGSSSIVDMSGSYTINAELKILDGTVIMGSIIAHNATTIEQGAIVNVGATVPEFADNLFIKGTINFTNTTGTKTFYNITVNSGGTWNNNSDANFYIAGDIVNNGTWYGCSGTGSTYYLQGTNKTLSGTGSIDMPRVNVASGASYSNLTTLTISTELSGAGSFTNGANATLNIGASSTSFSITTFDASATANTVNYNRVGDQDIRIPTSGIFYHLSVSNAYKKSMLAGFTVNGNLTVNASTELDCNNYQITGNNTGTLSVANGGQLSLGLSTNTQNILFPTDYTTANISLLDGSTVLYRAQNDQTISAIPSYYNLTLKDGTGASNKNLSGGTTLTVRNNLDLYNSSLTLVVGSNTLDVNGTISGVGALSMGSGSFYLSGDFTMTGTFTCGTGTVQFDGTSDQYLTTSISPVFYNVVLNKASGKLILSKSSTVDGNLTFTSGNIVTTATYLLTLGTSAACTGMSNNSYVEGPVAKIMTSTSPFMFPTGKNGNYLSVGVTPASTSSVTFRAEYFDTTSNNSSVGSGIDHVSQIEYFQLDRTNGSTNASVTLSWDAQSYVDGNALGDLRVSKWNGSQWIDMGQASINGNGSSGNITSNIVTSFSPFKLASATSSSPLPVNLISFSGEVVNKQIELNWETASEINNDYFSIEKSLDGINYEEINKVKGSGNSSLPIQYLYIDENPFIGTFYYRLKQVDFNGTYEYSSAISVYYEADTESMFTILSDKLTPSTLQFIVSGSANQSLTFDVIDLSGKICHTEQYTIHQNNELITMTLSSQLRSGMYVLRMHSGNGQKNNQKLLIP